MRFVWTTVIGGIVFLFPIVVLILIIGKGLNIVRAVLDPVYAALPFRSVGGVAIFDVMTFVALILICFAAGLLARTFVGKGVVGSLEKNILSKIPMYTALKLRAGSALNPGSIQDVFPVCARFDDYHQMALEVDRLAGGRVVVFVPNAPDFWSGATFIMTEDRITRLDLSLGEFADLAKQLGRGSKEALPSGVP